jgi:FMN phosphatase YigB (HAD superfamily)
MNHKLVCFDLQGTLTDSSFSDEFWLQLLPKLYANFYHTDIFTAKNMLKERFQSYGKYDERYYSNTYWLEELHINQSLQELTSLEKNQPVVYRDMLEFVVTFQDDCQIVVVSTTTCEFINIELGKDISIFPHIYSTIDDFDIAGKPKEVFLKIANIFGFQPKDCINIGDSQEMDVKNAISAGFDAYHFSPDKTRSFHISKLKKFL